MMSGHALPLAKNALLLAAAFLITAPSVVAGDRVHAGRPAILPQTASAAVAPATSLPVIISVVTTLAPKPDKERDFVALRGPDGQVRRFPLEGGPDVIQVRRLVLRPGQTLTIQVARAK
jgi:hypothetical protein